MNKAHWRHDVGPKESCDKENTAAYEKSSNIAPWHVMSTEPAVNAIPHTLPVTYFKEGIDYAVYSVTTILT